MNKRVLLAGSVLLFGFAAYQTNVPPTLAKDFERLGTLPGLTATFKFRIVGDAPTEYQLALAKPNRFKLTWEDGFVQSDGKSLYQYTKSSNSYTEEPLTDDSVAAFVKRPELFGWSAFFVKKPEELVATAKQSGTRVMLEHDVNDVDVTMKKDQGEAKLFLDKKLAVARGYTLKRSGKDYLVVASKLDVQTDPVDDKEFKFTAPDGATKAVAVADDATYAKVQAIMNETCMPCHSATSQRGGFDLSNYDGIMMGVKAGDAGSSELVRVLHATDGSRMPRGRGPLSDAQIKVISTWINKGAKK